jgi:hypothetical protein
MAGGRWKVWKMDGNAQGKTPTCKRWPPGSKAKTWLDFDWDCKWQRRRSDEASPVQPASSASQGPGLGNGLVSTSSRKEAGEMPSLPGPAPRSPEALPAPPPSGPRGKKHGVTVG